MPPLSTGMFSQQELCASTYIFSRTPIKAYPKLKPQKTVPIILSKNLFYVNSFESLISTMETEAISGKNVAKLVAVALGHPVQKI